MYGVECNFEIHNEMSYPLYGKTINAGTIHILSMRRSKMY